MSLDHALIRSVHPGEGKLVHLGTSSGSTLCRRAKGVVPAAPDEQRPDCPSCIDRLTRFWARVDRSGPRSYPGLGRCWVWTGPTNNYGYGTLGVTLAHRLAWLIATGETAGHLHVLHACDFRRCVRPSHLFLGTNKENNDDMMAKGRHGVIDQRGPRNHQAKLSDQDVLAIRAACASGTSQRLVAAEYGISQPTVSDLVTRRRWGHLHG